MDNSESHHPEDKSVYYQLSMQNTSDSLIRHNRQQPTMGENKLDSSEGRNQEEVMEIRWPDSISSNLLWEQTNQISMEEEMGKKCWKWIGHRLRKARNCITRQAFTWDPQHQMSSRERTKKKSCREMEIDMKKMNKNWMKLEKKAHDRQHSNNAQQKRCHGWNSNIFQSQEKHSSIRLISSTTYLLTPVTPREGA
ncbi:unnamed protein product [Schistosoma curassoni]|uniref:Ovule protein n=1 Tax=Schistosoma curassoni TaxID=6186 RepID=A0A183JDW3_9TREM|nr:unnamed protein product [Schistosoma curassoni]